MLEKTLNPTPDLTIFPHTHPKNLKADWETSETPSSDHTIFPHTHLKNLKADLERDVGSKG